MIMIAMMMMMMIRNPVADEQIKKMGLANGNIYNITIYDDDYSR